MKFSYKRYGRTLRPVIPVQLRNGAACVGYEVLVDSGADLCIFSAEIGELLGIDVTKGAPKDVFGIGGKASLYYQHQVDLIVGSRSRKILAGFMPDASPGGS